MIIISPTKTMQFDDIVVTSIRPNSKHETLLKKYRKLSRKKMEDLYSVSDKILDQVYKQWKNFEELPENSAINAYTGLSYQGIKPKSYSDEELNWLEQHVTILSAFYGPITPSTMVRAYRLDFKIDPSLYQFWNVTLPEPIINLASAEFSKLIKQPMITVSFLEEVDGVLKNKATYTKQARGYLVNYLIKQKSETLDTIKKFDELGYLFSEEESSETTITFIRKK